MTNNSNKLYLGCISGTSVDGLDIALLSLTENRKTANNKTDQTNVEILQATTAEFPANLRQQLLSIAQPEQDDLDLLGQCDVELGRFIGTACLSFLAEHNYRAEQIVAIGSHGQTVRHRPPDANGHGFTTQIGDPNCIVEITGIQTVADFRRRDMAAGGHGAPLVPGFHGVLFGGTKLSGEELGSDPGRGQTRGQTPSSRRGGEQGRSEWGQTPGGVRPRPVVLNVGGISNVSVLGAKTSGFDTGPGNGLMDSWCEIHRGQPFDRGGQWAATGKVDDVLLQHCLNDPYFALAPPKSTGREYFNMAWLSSHLEKTNATPADVQATLCELTARCTTDALDTLQAGGALKIEDIIVCGGGRLNEQLMQRLQHNTAATVSTSEAWGVDGDSIEAALFAWLAYLTLNAKPGNEPAVTGAAGYRILGGIYLP